MENKFTKPESLFLLQSHRTAYKTETAGIHQDFLSYNRSRDNSDPHAFPSVSSANGSL